MRSSGISDLTEPDPEIERTIRCLLKEKRDQEMKMANTKEGKALRDYAMKSTSAATSYIVKPTITVNNF